LLSTKAVNHKLHVLGLAALCAALLACSARKDEPRYAELRISPALEGKVQLLICADHWRGLAGPDGFEGYARNIYFWTTLNGPGPRYEDPVLHENAPRIQREYRGTITVDREKGEAVIDLHTAASEPNAAQSQPSGANGTYQIKRVTKEAFLPE
jgi:hypothetical protein